MDNISIDPETDDSQSTAVSDTPNEPMSEPEKLDERSKELRALSRSKLMDYEAFEALRKKKRKKLVVAGYTVLGLAVFVVPIVYLKSIGEFSTASIRKPTGSANSIVKKSLPLNSPMKTIPELSDPPPIDPVAKDLKNYVTVEIARLAPLEKSAMLDYWGTTGSNYKSDAVSAQIIRDKVIPEYRRYIAGLSALHPKTSEVSDLNKHILAISQLRLDAFVEIGQSAGTKDTRWRGDVAKILSRVDAENADLNRETKKLIQEHPK